MSEERIIVSVGIQGYAGTAKRFMDEATAAKVFHKLMFYHAIPDEWGGQAVVAHRSVMGLTKGAGWMWWKPFAVAAAMKDAKDGDVVVWIDSGCTLAPGDEWGVYFDALQHNDVVCIQLDHLPEWKFTKGATVQGMGVTGDRILLTSGQLISGIIFFRVCDGTRKLVQAWKDAACHYDWISGDKDVEEMAGFVDHRHDQSLLSLLLKKHVFGRTDATEPRVRVAVLPDLTYPPGREGQVIAATRRRD